MVKEVGWDDAFVVLAQASNTAATILVCICKLIMLAKCTWLTMPAVNYGLGTHMLYIPLPRLMTYLKVCTLSSHTHTHKNPYLLTDHCSFTTSNWACT